MSYVFNPAPRPTVAVAGESSRFPVSRIFCIGKNYAAHAREMGVDPDAEPPSIFMKPATSVVDASVGLDATLPYPPLTKNLHHEIELVVAIGTGGSNISVDAALEHVFGFGVGLDLTRRDMQSRAKDKRQPWAMSKGFDFAAPMAPLHRIDDWSAWESGRIWSAVDGDVRQDGDLAEMIWPVPNIINVLSRHLALVPGDLIFTGTPAGVGPVLVGETITGGAGELTELSIRVV
jgi:fumarylpyruvate hydrolase